MLIFILISLIGVSCIGFIWWKKKRRRDLPKATTNGERAADGRGSGKIHEAQADPVVATRDNALNADFPLAGSETVVENKEETTELSDEVDVPKEARDIASVCPVQTEPAAAAIENDNVTAGPSFPGAIAGEVGQPIPSELEKPEEIPLTKPQKAPVYQPPRPAPPVVPLTTAKQPKRQPFVNRDSELHLRVRLVFNRDGSVRSLSLVPDRRPVMPAEIEVTGTQGDFPLTQLQERCYQDVHLPDIGLALRNGVEWVGKGATNRRWRWVLGTRELYVLAPGGDVGLSGFVSVPRLLLGDEHVVLSAATLRADVLAALTQAGCGEPEMMDETFPSVPAGWVLFRRVRPTCAVPERDQPHILNALCAKRDIEPHLVGGIRLKRRSWLLGYPPRIRFTGETSTGVEVRIDGSLADPAEDGGFEAPGWDNEGRHSLWFAGRLRKYSLQRGPENWDTWSAYNFGTDAAICGASVRPVEQVRLRSVRVPSQNTVLVGPEPGQIFRCRPRSDLRTDTCLAMVPFEPVWALPSDPMHVDKRSVRVVLVSGFEPVRPTPLKNTNRASNPTVAAWYTAINDAGRKGLALATDDANAIALWQSYRREAKRIWRAMR